MLVEVSLGESEVDNMHTFVIERKNEVRLNEGLREIQIYCLDVTVDVALLMHSLYGVKHLDLGVKPKRLTSRFMAIFGEY